jgi:hypothetical protein
MQPHNQSGFSHGLFVYARIASRPLPEAAGAFRLLNASVAFKSPNGTKRPFVSREPLVATTAFIRTDTSTTYV